jgi:AcrR family transcriptional regulator
MPRPRSDIRERVVEVAIEQFLAQGVDGASLRSIAARAKTSIGMVYYYFTTKDELFLAVVESVYPAVLARLTAALESNGNDRDGFRARVERLYACLGSFDERERQVLRLVVREALVSNERLASVFERFRRGHLPLLIKLVTDGSVGGHIDSSHHPLVAMICLGAIGALPQVFVHAAAERLPMAEVPRGEALVRELADIYLRGLGPWEGGPRDEAGPARGGKR